MAPVSNLAVVGIDDDQRFALMKFRRSVKDVLRPEHNDHFLLRWLRARQWDAAAAEKMLRESMRWREKWGVDTTLPSWQPPEVFSDYFPSGTTGFDKQGSPIIFVPFAGFDMYGMLHSVTRTDLIRVIIIHLEKYLNIAREQSLKYGPNALKVVVVFDLDGFNLKQYAWKPAAEVVFACLQMYEANYPETLKTAFIINAPKMFSFAFSIVKKFLNEATLAKIHIYGHDSHKWQKQILNVIDKEVVPKYFGGTLVDENGDPKCSAMIKQGGKVPKEFYQKDLVHESEKEYVRTTVKTGDKHVVDLICPEQESILKWEVGVEQHDIKFVIKRVGADGGEAVVVGPRRLTEGPEDVGALAVTGPATYSVIFDNKSSYLRNKKIYYDVEITRPIDQMNIADELVAATEAIRNMDLDNNN